MLKNATGQKFPVFAFYGAGHANEGEPVTGDSGNITALISKDGAATSALTDTNPVEIGAGYYVFDVSQTECNADLVLIIPSSSTADVEVVPVFGAHTGVNVEAMNAHALLGDGSNSDQIRTVNT